MPRYKVAVIIPVFNQWPLTAGCLRSLREHTPREDVQVIVVDNGSTDETAQACGPLGRGLFGERFEFVRLEKNINFGPGCNLGARRADADFLFFLNNDTLLTPDWLSPLLISFENNVFLGAVGPLLLFPGSGRVQHLGVVFRSDRYGVHIYDQFPSNHPLVCEKKSFQAITGAALMVPRSLFFDIDCFFDGYKNGYEDFDLCFRLRRSNYKVFSCTNSKIYHLSSKTNGRFCFESLNRNIFLSRFGSDIVHDFSDIIEKDGYKVSQDALGRECFELRREIRDNLLSQIKQNQSIDFLWNMVCQEPMFVEGYDLLSRILENQGEWNRACGVRFLRVHFAPTFTSCRKLLNAARNAKNNDIEKLATVALKTIQLKK